MSALAQTPSLADSIRVALFLDGHIEIDGARVELGNASAKLKASATQHHVVRWYREQTPNGAPSPAQEKVFKPLLTAVADLGLPISFTSKPDFSDVVKLN
ncbi:MAG TPA: hypothetical protein VG942_14265 [Hyphomonadaceae bacterium]|nr:hypothetical protein [Hyphomonadaceae bacterium]